MQPMSIPKGWKLVPLLPTEDMVAAGFEIHPCGIGQRKVSDCYTAMIEAAPKPPTEKKK